MTWSVLLTCALIALARITDITLDTIRTVAIVQGRRGLAAVLGFFGALIFVCAVAKVLQNFDHPAYALAYATGYAAGTYLGIAIDQRLAFGEQLVTVFTRFPGALAQALRGEGFALTEFEGQGRDGAVGVLYIQTARRRAVELAERARELDPECFYVLNDVRTASTRRRAGAAGLPPPPAPTLPEPRTRTGADS